MLCSTKTTGVGFNGFRFDCCTIRHLRGGTGGESDTEGRGSFLLLALSDDWLWRRRREPGEDRGRVASSLRFQSARLRGLRSRYGSGDRCD